MVMMVAVRTGRAGTTVTIGIVGAGVGERIERRRGARCDLCPRGMSSDRRRMRAVEEGSVNLFDKSEPPSLKKLNLGIRLRLPHLHVEFHFIAET